MEFMGHVLPLARAQGEGAWGVRARSDVTPSGCDRVHRYKLRVRSEARWWWRETSGPAGSASRTRDCCAARVRTSTICARMAACTPPSCGARIRTPGSSPSTPRRRWPCRASSACSPPPISRAACHPLCAPSPKCSATSPCRWPPIPSASSASRWPSWSPRPATRPRMASPSSTSSTSRCPASATPKMP